MQIGPFVITRQKAAGADLVTRWPTTQGSWWPIIRESFAGAWQRGVVVPVTDALTHPTFFACVTLIADDIAKMRPKLVLEDPATGICEEVSNSAYSPVLAKPNRYQNRIQFYTYWIISKLTRGNAYALKERDQRGVISRLYLLDPTRCTPTITPSGDVYYAIGQDTLAGVTEATTLVPASEIIHDRMNTLYHPLAGLSPVYACGQATLQGLEIVYNTTRFFKNGTQIGGVLTTPNTIGDDMADRLKRHWEENYAGPENAGRVAVLGDGLVFQRQEVMSAVDAQLIDQLKWGDEKVAATFHVPAYMVGVGSAPLNNNAEVLQQQYYSQCLQALIESLELCLDEGLELKPSYGIEFDLKGLLRMDSAQMMDVLANGVKGGIYSPNEARAEMNLPPVQGGETPYLQQQNYSLAALDKRDQAAPAPHSSAPIPTPQPTPSMPAQPTKEIEPDQTAAYLSALMGYVAAEADWMIDGN